MNIYPAAGVLNQISNLSFFLAAVFGDILLIRLFLTLAYVFLLISAALGFPRWPSVDSTGGIALDSLAWACCSGCLHGIALVRLLLDERAIHFKSADEEQLWRFFYRRGGMERLEMAQVLRYGRWRQISAGETILNPSEACSQLCLLVEGTATFIALNPGSTPQSFPSLLFSGAFFDMKLFNVFGVYIGLEGAGPEKQFHAVAQTQCLLYTWSIEDLNALATRSSPAVSSYWRNVIACQLGLTFEWRESPTLPPRSATGDLEDLGIFKGDRSRDFTDPLRRYERPSQRRCLPALWLRWLRRSVHPFMPPGMRHNDLPVHGILARNRIVALKNSELRTAAAAALGGGMGAPRCDIEADNTLQALRQLDSLRVLEDTDVLMLARDVSVRAGSAFRPSLVSLHSSQRRDAPLEP